MSKIEASLIPGERVADRARVSPRVLHGTFAAGACLALVAVWASGGLSEMMAGWPKGMVSVPLVAVALIFLLWSANAARSLWALIGQEAAITQSRLLVRRGLFAVEQFDLPLARIESVEISQSLLGRMLGYGDVSITGVGSQVVNVFGISDPSWFRVRVLTAQGALTVASTSALRAESAGTDHS